MPRSRQETERLQALTSRRWGPRSRWVCVYCGRPANQIDHFFPKAGGGTDEPHNLVPGCERCNGFKSDHDPVAWMKAVGVPFARAEVLWDLVHTPSVARREERPTAFDTRVVLDYEPGKAVRQLRRPRKGK